MLQLYCIMFTGMKSMLVGAEMMQRTLSPELVILLLHCPVINSTLLQVNVLRTSQSL